MKTYFMTYGDELYRNQIQRLTEMASLSGFFHEVRAFGPDDLEPEFRWEFNHILNYHRGGGYWIWKPYLVKRMLNTIHEGDVLVYCDAGCEINQDAKKRFREYIEMICASPTGSLAFRLPHREVEYTKQEVFSYFSSPAEVIESEQLMATVFFLRKCGHTSFLAETWFHVLEDKDSLFTDELNEKLQDRRFIAHRHDQSVFSLIRKQYGSEIIPDETFFNDFSREGSPYPIWATRKRG
ncbi:hypothetical protein [Pararcticibacter amylolyticus]|uniref:Uncharacterized protein n=1 Tax=Pararcticibacter amylolyticus TaxID=2173175 RepID=A0A2U2PFM5_9SPHI|nr:hypothetical protein [Pararcticibacter amylolyticus]PWG80208.1 hypothetical protein DDR33_13525 [Pararcticibacter amylolyticus]